MVDIENRARYQNNLDEQDDDDDEDELDEDTEEFQVEDQDEDSSLDKLNSPSLKNFQNHKNHLQENDDENIFLFVPNLIGYVRVLLGLLSFLTMPAHPILTLVLYFFSTFLDAFDGVAARELNQSTKFGALLDQLTDRCTTLGLFLVLGTFYSSHLFWFQLTAVIDIVSHWMFLQVTVMCGKAHHKMVTLDDNWLLYHYYNNKKVLFFMCFAYETFFISLYMLHFYQGPIILLGFGLFRLTAIVTGPWAIIKIFISLVHLVVACINCKNLDVAARRAAQKRKFH